MNRRILLLCLSLFSVESVLAEIDLSGLPIEKAKSLQNNLQIIQEYFDQIKNAANSSDNTSVNPSSDRGGDINQNGVDKNYAESLGVLGEELALLGKSDFALEANASMIESKPVEYPSRLSIRQRDPFAITPRMFEGDPSLQDLGLNFQPDTELEVPEIKLKGVVNGVDGEIAALVDVEDVGVIVVREGDTIGVRSKDGGGLRVRKISRTGLILTAGSLGQDVIVK